MAKKDFDSLMEIERRAYEVLNNGEAAIQSFLELEESAKKRVEAATIETENAYKAADEKTYHKALEEKRHNEDMLKMYHDKAEDLRKNPLITKEELAQIADQITAVVDGYLEEQLKSYTKTIESLFAQRKEVEKMIGHANTLLELAQKKLYKDPCGVVTPSGEFKPCPWQEMKYANTALRDYLVDITRQQYNFDLLIQTHDREEIIGANNAVWGVH